MAKVYHAINRRSKEEFAIKRITLKNNPNPGIINMIQNEIQSKIYLLF